MHSYVSLLRETDGNFTHREEGAMKEEQRDMQMLVLKIRGMQQEPQAKKSW